MKQVEKPSENNVDKPRFRINGIVMADFKSLTIVDMQENKIVCHLVYENGREYCNEVANKMLAELNGNLVLNEKIS
jgi:hypothetical protein